MPSSNDMTNVNRQEPSMNWTPREFVKKADSLVTAAIEIKKNPITQAATLGAMGLGTGAVALASSPMIPLVATGFLLGTAAIGLTRGMADVVNEMKSRPVSAGETRKIMCLAMVNAFRQSVGDAPKSKAEPTVETKGRTVEGNIEQLKGFRTEESKQEISKARPQQQWVSGSMPEPTLEDLYEEHGLKEYDKYAEGDGGGSATEPAVVPEFDDLEDILNQPTITETDSELEELEREVNNFTSSTSSSVDQPKTLETTSLDDDIAQMLAQSDKDFEKEMNKYDDLADTSSIPQSTSKTLKDLLKEAAADLPKTVEAVPLQNQDLEQVAIKPEKETVTSESSHELSQLHQSLSHEEEDAILAETEARIKSTTTEGKKTPESLDALDDLIAEISVDSSDATAKQEALEKELQKSLGIGDEKSVSLAQEDDTAVPYTLDELLKELPIEPDQAKSGEKTLEEVQKGVDLVLNSGSSVPYTLDQLLEALPEELEPDALDEMLATDLEKAKAKPEATEEEKLAQQAKERLAEDSLLDEMLPVQPAKSGAALKPANDHEALEEWADSMLIADDMAALEQEIATTEREVEILQAELAAANAKEAEAAAAELSPGPPKAQKETPVSVPEDKQGKEVSRPQKAIVDLELEKTGTDERLKADLDAQAKALETEIKRQVDQSNLDTP